MNVIKNWGKMIETEVVIPAATIPHFNEGEPDIVVVPERTARVQGNADGTWYNLTKDIPLKDGQWFIAVQDGDGFIACCERDPTMISLVGYDIWQIEHPGPREEIFCKFWDGKEVVDDNGQS